MNGRCPFESRGPMPGHDREDHELIARDLSGANFSRGCHVSILWIHLAEYRFRQVRDDERDGFVGSRLAGLGLSVRLADTDRRHIGFDSGRTAGEGMSCSVHGAMCRLA